MIRQWLIIGALAACTGATLNGCANASNKKPVVAPSNEQAAAPPVKQAEASNEKQAQTSSKKKKARSLKNEKGEAYSIVYTKETSSGEIIIEKREFEKNENDPGFPRHEIWLRYKRKKVAPRLLFEDARSDSLLFSPNDEYIAVNSRPGSDNLSASLMKRKQGLEYDHAKSLDDLAWDKFYESNGKTVGDALVWHSVIEVVEWGGNSEACLIKLSTQGSTEASFDGWYCVYDVVNDKVSLDLSAMNRNAVSVTKKYSRR